MVAALENVASHKKRHKKRQQRTLDLWHDLVRILAPYGVIGTRGAYYRAVAAGLVSKDDRGYNRVQRALLDMRREGWLSYAKICDNSRVRSRTYQADDLQGALSDLLSQYRIDYWRWQPFNVEIWCEKDAMTPIVQPVCDEYGVYYAALRGFDSESFIYDIAEQLKKEVRRPTKVYYLGDHDPSGWWIADNLERRLKDFGADVRVVKLAVHPHQMQRHGLGARDAKKKDTRYRRFVEHFQSDMCMDVDAIPPDEVQQMVRKAIEDNINWAEWERLQANEAAQTETLRSLSKLNFTPGATYRLPDESEGGNA